MLIYPSPVSECTHACYFVTVVCFHSESPSPCLHLGDHYSIILVFQDLPSSPHLWSVQYHTVTWASSVSPLLLIISATPQMTLTPDSQSSAAPSQTVLLPQWLCVAHKTMKQRSPVPSWVTNPIGSHQPCSFFTFQWHLPLQAPFWFLCHYCPPVYLVCPPSPFNIFSPKELSSALFSPRPFPQFCGFTNSYTRWLYRWI